MEFSIESAKFLLLFVLCIALESRVDAENRVTVISFDADVPGNDVVDSWNYDLADSLISSTIHVKKNCPGTVMVDIRMYEDTNMINTFSQQLHQPLSDLKSNNICASTDYPEPDDDSCSMAEGEQSAYNCDMSPWFSDMDPGEYKIECDFKQEDDILANLKIHVKVESE